MMKHKFRILSFLLITLFGSVYAQCPPDHFIMPTNGIVSSVIGMRNGRMHEGLDIASADGRVGAPVVAAGGGTVIVRDAGGSVPGTGYDPNGYGDYVIIRHPNGTTTLYGHLDSVTVRDGQTVSQGQPIGTLGNSGGSDGPHLHFEFSNTELGPPVTLNGGFWDQAAGIDDEERVSQGSCLQMAAGPGGQVAGQPGTQPGGQPTNGNGQGANGGNGQPANGGGQGNGQAGNGGAQPPASNGQQPAANGRTDQLPFDVGINLRALLPEPLKWMTATINLLNQYNLPGHLNTLAIVLLFAAFVYSIVNANYFHRTDQYFAIFGRMIIAAGLIFGSPAIANGMKNMWFGIYNNLEARVVRPAVDDLERHINGLRPLISATAVAATYTAVLAAGIPDTIDFSTEAGIVVASVKAGAAIDAPEELVKLMNEKANQLTRLIFTLMVMMGSLYGIYFLAIYTSGITMILAGILLPVLAALMMLPGSSSWFTKWFGMVVTCLVLVTVFPFVMRVVVDQGVNEPIDQANNLVRIAQQEMQEFQATIGDRPAITDVKAWGAFVLRTVAAMTGLVNNFMEIVIRWVFQTVVLAISVIASIFLMQQIPGLISGFMGGVAGAAAGAVSGGALAGLLSVNANGSGNKNKSLAIEPTPGRTPAPYSSGPRSTEAGGARAALPAAGGSSAGALPPAGGTAVNMGNASIENKQMSGGSSRGSLPGGASSPALSGSGPQASLPGGSGASASMSGGSSSGELPKARGTTNYRTNGGQVGNWENDPSVNTVDTTATGGRTNPNPKGAIGGTPTDDIGQARIEQPGLPGSGGAIAKSSSNGASSGASASMSGGGSSGDVPKARGTENYRNNGGQVGNWENDANATTVNTTATEVNSGGSNAVAGSSSAGSIGGRSTDNVGKASIEQKQLSGSSNSGALPAAGQTGPVLETQRGDFSNHPDVKTIDTTATRVK
jgi:murein DD-endopeptidase MepM/ murein hydrolase activator NlpD